MAAVIVFDVVLDKREREFRNPCVVRGGGREGSFKCMLTQGTVRSGCLLRIHHGLADKASAS